MVISAIKKFVFLEVLKHTVLFPGLNNNNNNTKSGRLLSSVTAESMITGCSDSQEDDELLGSVDVQTYHPSVVERRLLGN